MKMKKKRQCEWWSLDISKQHGGGNKNDVILIATPSFFDNKKTKQDMMKALNQNILEFNVT